MKIRARIIFWLLCAIYLSAAGCDNSGGDRPSAIPATLEIDDPRVDNGIIYVDAAAVTINIMVKTNVKDWTAQAITDNGWAVAEPLRNPPVPTTELEVTQKLKISVGENTGSGSRSAVVIVSGAGIERTLKVVQVGAGSMLTFDSPAYAQATGETIAVAVTTNVEYTVSMPADREWIENVTSSPEELKFRVTENDGMQPRSASIVVAAKDVPNLRRTLVVEQQGRGAAINIDGPQEITLAYDDTELALNVTANVAYRIAFEYETPGTEWIWSMETRAMTMKKEEFALNRNMGAEPRTAIVHFISEGVSPVIMRDVSITQDGHEGLDDSIFELWNTSELRTVSYSKQNIAVSIRTGKQPKQITLGQLPEWIVQDGATASTAETLIYTFAVDENRWPLARNHAITFAANGVTLTVNLRQDGAPVSYQTVDYNSLTGSFTGGSFGTLCDFDLSNSLTGELPGDWIFGLRRPDRDTFNQMIYYPVSGSPAYGITDYELLACSHASGTWYTVASGSIPASLYQSAESMREGYAIKFPTVENAQRFRFRVKNSQGGSIFGASELHLAYDYTQQITSAPSIELLTPSPLTIPASATSASIAISATTPYNVTFDSPSPWIYHDESLSEPGILRFAVQPNPGAERSATVTLRSTATGVDVEKSFTFTQSASSNNLSFLTPASGHIDLAASNSSFTVDLSTNLSKNEITASGLAHWIEETEKSDIAGGVQFRFSATDNPGGVRSNTITFSGGGQTLNLSVDQAAMVELIPTLSLQSPASGTVSLAASGGNFSIALATNMGPADITVGAFPAWLTAATPLNDNGIVTWNFTAEANHGEARDAVLTFSTGSHPMISVTVSQSEQALPGVPLTPTEAVWYDHSINSHDAYEAIDGDKSTYLTLPSTTVWSYEFRFPYGNDLAAFIYYPRDSDDEHGSLKTLEINAVCHPGGVSVKQYIVEIPPSLYATPASRRVGYLITLPVTARRISHIRIIPIEGYQSDYSIAEIEFFGPK